MRHKSQRYFVYILSNSNKTLYVGVTNNLFARVWQHRHSNSSKFVVKHDLSKLVWFDETDDVSVAIAHEKKLKNWRRQWKIDLVESSNPEWLDLASEWYEVENDSESSSE